jgi:hypothetical protein
MNNLLTSVPVGVSVLAVVTDSTPDFLVANAPVRRVTNVRLGEVGIITQIGRPLKPDVIGNHGTPGVRHLAPALGGID